jgi:hypothetical protein
VQEVTFVSARIVTMKVSLIHWLAVCIKIIMFYVVKKEVERCVFSHFCKHFNFFFFFTFVLMSLIPNYIIQC